jgi:phosphoenolpyruvate-protein kinase (PTS system EI component)
MRSTQFITGGIACDLPGASTSALPAQWDTGGVLSHSAVVAREYMIPAVVGTARATITIQDGQMIEVDGSAGVVRRIE